MHFSSPEKRVWLVTDAYAIVISLQAPIYFRFVALISWFWVVMNHKRVYSQENAPNAFSQARTMRLVVLQALFCRALSRLSSGETWLNAYQQVR